MKEKNQRSNVRWFPTGLRTKEKVPEVLMNVFVCFSACTCARH